MQGLHSPATWGRQPEAGDGRLRPHQEHRGIAPLLQAWADPSGCGHEAGRRKSRLLLDLQALGLRKNEVEYCWPAPAAGAPVHLERCLHVVALTAHSHLTA